MSNTVQYYSGPGGTSLETGYIIDGKTYVDEEGTQRVSVGSIVMTNDGDYILTDQGGMLYSDYQNAVATGEMDPILTVTTETSDDSTDGTGTTNGGTSTGGMPTGTGSGVDSTASGYINEIYDAQIAANQAALENAYELNVNTINAQKEALPQTYRTAKNATASQAEVAKSNFNEYAAAAGLSSGTGGQAQLSMSNQLQGSLSELDQAQADALAELDLQLTNLTTQYQNDLALAFAEGNLAKVAALYQNYESNLSNLVSQQQFDATLDYNYDALDATSDDTQYSRALSIAQWTGIFDGMAAYGWTQEEIDAAEANWKAANS